MTKLVVTGSRGLIGGRFVEEMRKDQRYVLKEFEGDIRDRDNVTRNLRDADIVVHFAALTVVPVSWDAPMQYMDVNYGGTINVLENHSLFKKLVFVNTCYVFGQAGKAVGVDTQPMSPNDPYAISKMAAYSAVSIYAKRFGFDLLTVQPFNNFGPGQGRGFVMPAMILQALKNRKIVLRGDSEREMIYAEDTARAMKKMIDDGRTGTVNVCKGEVYRISDLAKEVLSILGLEPDVHVAGSDRPSDIKKMIGDPSSFYDAVPGFSFTPMEQAISKTIDYYRREA